MAGIKTPMELSARTSYVIAKNGNVVFAYDNLDASDHVQPDADRGEGSEREEVDRRASFAVSSLTPAARRACCSRPLKQTRWFTSAIISGMSSVMTGAIFDISRGILVSIA